MKEILKNTLEVLKKRIRFNLDLIHENENKIREILKEPVSEDRSARLNQRFNVNKSLIKENNDSLKIQKDIIDYLNSYHKEIAQFPEILEVNTEYFENSDNKKNTKIEITREDYFDLTINKSLEFDSRHPFYNDEEFVDQLLTHFIDVEDYEMCASISKIKSNNNQLAN